MNHYYIADKELYHHGILGMKWGVRRYQNLDGTLTEEGKRRYGDSESGHQTSSRDRFFKSKKYRINEIRSDFRKKTGKSPEDVSDELDKEWAKLTDPSDNKLWAEYSKYYANNLSNEKVKKLYNNDRNLAYKDCIKNGRGSMDWTSSGWEWYTTVKNPSLGVKDRAFSEYTSRMSNEGRNFCEVALEKVFRFL